MRRSAAWLLAALHVALLAACAVAIPPAERLASPGTTRLLLRGDPFEHAALYREGKPSGVLHVYIEHDGSPWRSTTQPAADPTPRNRVMLELMQLDRAPVLYLGRPCYFGEATRPPCEPVWWTHWRYSPAVIASMNAALARFLATHREFTGVELYGFSGGGVIAALMASGVGNATALVTLAAPLDLAGWTALHDYSALTGSLDPSAQPPLRASIIQLHIAGSEDRNVPPALVERYVRRQTNAKMITVDGLDHVCCWERVWMQNILAR